MQAAAITDKSSNHADDGDEVTFVTIAAPQAAALYQAAHAYLCEIAEYHPQAMATGTISPSPVLVLALDGLEQALGMDASYAVPAAEIRAALGVEQDGTPTAAPLPS